MELRRLSLRSFFVSFFTASQFLALTYYIYFYHTNKYLPSPFLFDKNDTFMDFFNCMWWTFNGGAYTLWHSIYPPLNFIFLWLLKVLSFNDFNSESSFALRENSGNSFFFLFAFYLASPHFVLKSSLWSTFSSQQRKFLYIAFLICTPMLFALERGNLIITSLFLIPWIFSSSIYIQIVAIALLINIKPYFSLLLILFVVKRKFNSFIICLIFSGLIFIITGAIYDENYILLFSNLFGFSQNITPFSLREVLAMPSSISVFTYILNSPNFSKTYPLIFDPKIISLIIETIKIIVLLFSGYVICKCSKDLKESHLVALILILITNIGISIGGYSLILYLFIIPVLFELRFSWLYISLVLVMFFPLDFISLYSQSIGVYRSFLSGIDVNVIWTEGLGSFLKPIINLLILVIMDIEFFIGMRRSSL